MATDASDNGQLVDLLSKIDNSDCYARNEASGFPMTNLFIGDTRLGCKSDADEQLILHVSFQEFVKVSERVLRNARITKMDCTSLWTRGRNIPTTPYLANVVNPDAQYRTRGPRSNSNYILHHFLRCTPSNSRNSTKGSTRKRTLPRFTFTSTEKTWALKTATTLTRNKRWNSQLPSCERARMRFRSNMLNFNESRV